MNIRFGVKTNIRGTVSLLQQAISSGSIHVDSGFGPGVNLDIDSMDPNQRFQHLVSPVLKAMGYSFDTNMSTRSDGIIDLMFNGITRYGVRVVGRDVLEEPLNIHNSNPSWRVLIQTDGVVYAVCEPYCDICGNRHFKAPIRDRMALVPEERRAIVNIGVESPELVTSWLLQYSCDPCEPFEGAYIPSEPESINPAGVLHTSVIAQLQEKTTEMVVNVLAGNISDVELEVLAHACGIEACIGDERKAARKVVHDTLLAYREEYDNIVRAGGTPVNMSLEPERKAPRHLLVDVLTGNTWDPRDETRREFGEALKLELEALSFYYEHSDGRMFGGILESPNGEEVIRYLLDAVIYEGNKHGHPDDIALSKLSVKVPGLRLYRPLEADEVDYLSDLGCTLKTHWTLSEVLNVAPQVLEYLGAVPGSAILKCSYND